MCWLLVVGIRRGAVHGIPQQCPALKSYSPPVSQCNLHPVSMPGSEGALTTPNTSVVWGTGDVLKKTSASLSEATTSKEEKV